MSYQCVRCKKYLPIDSTNVSYCQACQNEATIQYSAIQLAALTDMQIQIGRVEALARRYGWSEVSATTPEIVIDKHIAALTADNERLNEQITTLPDYLCEKCDSYDDRLETECDMYENNLPCKYDAEYEPDRDRLDAMITHGWYVQKYQEFWMVYDETGEVVQGKTAREAIDNAIEENHEN